LFTAIPQIFVTLKSQHILGTVEDGAVLIGPVHVGAGSVVQSLAVIRGPAIIGNDTVVNSHAEILPHCFIGSNCVVGHCCSIIGSMLMNNVVVWHAAFVRNSVIGFGCVVGPGAVLGAEKAALLKNPLASTEIGVVLGDHTAIGAESILRPGTIIGRRTVVGESVLTEGTHGSDQIVTASQQLETKPRHG